jgi:putative OPT family oligopeptide transporter
MEDASASGAEHDAARPIDHHPDGSPMTQEEIDQYWLKHVFRPNERQLTVRAVITGMALGGLLSLSNLYVGLKTGWGLAVTVTAAVLAFGLFSLLRALVPLKAFRAEFTSLENNTMASAASAAGYFTGAGLTSAIPALFLTTGRVLNPWELTLWMLAISFLGVLLAVPMRRQMIDVDRLPFPEGLAYAETIRSLHAAPGAARRKSWVLFFGAIGGAFMKLASGPLALIPEEFPILGAAAAKATLTLQTDILMIGGGMLIGIRVCAGLLAGGLIGWSVLGRWLFGHGLAGTAPTYETVRTWILWPGVAMVVVNGLLSFGLRWRTALAALRGLRRLATGGQGGMAAVEVPGSWFIRGMALCTVFVVVLARILFDIPIWMGLLATALSAVLSIVACRATGETSITPVGALGKITQLMYGGLAAGNIQTNLMTASVTAGAAMHSADLLTDLKGGYVLGSRPRYQFLAQFFGILAGAAFCVPVYGLLATPERLGTPQFPAPAAMTWKAVAELLSHGLHRTVRGEVRAAPAEMSGLRLKSVPQGTRAGEVVHITAGKNAGAYIVAAVAGKTLVLDRALHDKEEKGPATLKDHDLGTVTPVALSAALVPVDGTEVLAGDYLQSSAPDGHEVWWAVQAVVTPHVDPRATAARLSREIVLDRPLLDPRDVNASFAGKPLTVRKESLPPYAATAVLIAALLAAVLTLLEVYLPPAWRSYVPSATGLGLGAMIAGSDSISMFIGSAIAWLWTRVRPASAEEYVLTVGSGIMAGASIAGVGLIVYQYLPVLFGH